MALAQPTGLQVQTLAPLVGLSQSVERYVIGDCRILTEAGDDLLVESGDTLSAEPCLVPLVDLTQVVDDSATLVAAGPIAGIEQTVRTLNNQASQALITLSQTVSRHSDGIALIRLRQVVRSDGSV
jgi:hypothetical protein